MMLFSKATGGFYLQGIHGDNIPSDAVEITKEQHAALMAAQSAGKLIKADGNGFPVAVDPPPPSQAVIIADLSAAIQKRLDDFAKTRIYDNVTSMSKYTQLTDAEIESLPAEDRVTVYRYRAECRHHTLKVAQTWAVSERIMAEVLAGTRPAPNSIDDFAAELPVLAWPT